MIEPVPLIDVIVEEGAWDSDAEATVRRAITEAAIATGRDFSDRVVAVLLTDDASIRRLNERWRHVDKPTNVLSFPSVSGPQGPVAALGDIAIAHETVAREAAAEGKPFTNHLAHLSVHGFLHLLGHDHDTDAAAKRMEALERAILARLGVPDPYLPHETLAREAPPQHIRG